MGKKLICFECGKKVLYEVKEMIRKYEGDGYCFELLVKVPFCAECGAPIYDEDFEEEIRKRANEKIREQREIIKREEILDILKRYNVSQKFLSRLLGWGEITLTRYVAGNYTPSQTNSNKLKGLNNPYVFQKFLEDNLEENSDLEKKLFEKAQNKVNDELHYLESAEGKILV